MPSVPDAGHRLALLIATSVYSDPDLRELRTPGLDAAELSAVLGDPRIGGFEVQTLVNVSSGEVQEGIEDFCADRHPDDQLLIYVSCHGVLDSNGRLYYTAVNTRRQRLAATAIAATWLTDRLDDSRARGQIVVLDCCHSGAFARGAKGDQELALEQLFEPRGRGRVVLTASRSTEYSFEGGQVSGHGVPSVFTHAIVTGLRTGEADRDRDGLITVTDLYQYVYDHVRATEPRQTPGISTYGAEGTLLVARSIRGPVIEPEPLPEDLRVTLESPRPRVRETGVAELADLLDAAGPGLSLAARQALERIAEQDQPQVAALARIASGAPAGAAADRVRQELTDRAQREEQARQEAARREAEERARLEAEEKAQREAEDKARREAEDKARRDAEDKARRDTEDKARRDTEDEAKGDEAGEGAPRSRGLRLAGRVVSRRRVLVATSAAVAVIGLLTAVIIIAPWTTPRTTPRRTTPPTPGITLPKPHVRWVYTTNGGQIDSSPAVVGSTVYVDGQDPNMYALDAATGHLQWTQDVGTLLTESSAALAGNTVYIGSDNQKVYALDAATGTVRWTHTTGDQVDSSPAVVDGTVYIGSEDDKVYALDAATGAVRWTYTTGDKVESSPAVVDGTVYIGSWDTKVYALDAATGHVRWTYTTGSLVISSPTVVSGTVYVGSDDNSVYALDAATGHRRWTYATGDAVESRPAVAGGIVYVGSQDHKVYALDATTGRLLWRYATGNQVNSSPAVADGTVYVGSEDHNVYALDATNGHPLWAYRTGDIVDSSPTVVGDTVYVGSNDSKVYALATTL